MIRIIPLLTLGAVLAAGPALAQSAASIGRSAGVVHGQSPMAGSQDLNGFGTGGGGNRPMTRNELVRQRAAAARAQAQANQPPRQARTTQRRRSGGNG
ncbi:hypothetical protein [Muricoccus radiodurans]|uniref:hypothetical protein n=1 Tax=Muricoccus radiodurans TaxID=2231721 RepID=UPI003CF26537